MQQLKVILLLSALVASPALANTLPCSLAAPCAITGKEAGTYYLAFPQNWDGKSKLKALVFFHGHGGSGGRVLRNAGLIQPLTQRGYVVVAPDGAEFNFRNRPIRGWAARRESSPRAGRSDIRFTEQVIADVARRIPIDAGKTIVSGFSSGGSMAWYFSCYSKMPLAGVIPIAGGLRRPLPAGGTRSADGALTATCPGGPRKVLHIHGYSDRQVPLEGRAIRAWHQGDVFAGLAIQRKTNKCGSRPDQIDTASPIWCRSWNRCESGKAIRFCLHSGGHIVPKGWPEDGLGWINQSQKTAPQ